MVALNKIHNLMINCGSKAELSEHVNILAIANLFNEVYDDLFDNTKANPVLAAECSVLPIYYFRASTKSGMKQDRFGKWYKGE